MTARARNGRFTAERTTETTTTERITERFILDEPDTLETIPAFAETLRPLDTGPLALAPGWEPALAALGGGPSLRAQRAGQVERCLDFLTLWAVSSPPGSPLPERLVPDAVIILRAGPNATPLELTLGRSI